MNLMVIRLVSFAAGAAFGAVGTIINFLWIEKSEIHWGIVGLSALVLGTLAALFGKKFWETAIGLWP
ncbi:MAG TPA: hypothetical protein VN836_07005 [Verrucomicrobiae bacterium]|nr:hypothetical protein [Verrucomicrobiae bacterium]